MQPVWRLLILQLCVVVTSGCGNTVDGPARFPLEGTVTVDGEPVPFGQIAFLPQGGGGMTSVGIVDGYYSAPPKGAVGGGQTVTVTLYSASPSSDGDEEPEVLGTATPRRKSEKMVPL